MRLLAVVCVVVCVVVLGVVLAATGAAQPGQSVASWLKASKWQRRVLLVCAPTPDNADLRRQQQLLGPARTGLDSRDLLVREVILSQLSASDKRYLQEKLGVSLTGFTAVLIGKDGGVKRRETAPMPPATLFTTIDAMPMRQQEMRDRP